MAKAHNRKEGDRTPSGRLSRSKSAKSKAKRKEQADAVRRERDALSLNLSNRMSKLGVSKRNARDQHIGDPVGYLCHKGKLTVLQRDAATFYLALYHGYMTAIGADGFKPDLPEDWAPSGDPEAAARYAAKTVRRFDEVNVRLNNIGRRALDTMVIRREFGPALIDDLAAALDIINVVRGVKPQEDDD